MIDWFFVVSLMPLPAIVQLYNGDQFKWWKMLEYPKRITDHSDKVYQFAQGRWFSQGTPASSTTKTGRHYIDEILLKVALKHQKSIIKINIIQSISHFAKTFIVVQIRLVDTIDNLKSWNILIYSKSEYAFLLTLTGQ